MIEISFYIPRGSPLHRLDPRAKILLLMAVLSLSVATRGPVGPAAVLALGVAGVAIAGVWHVLRRVRGLIATLFLTSLLLWSLFPMLAGGAASGIGVAALAPGIATGLKLAAMVVCSVLFLAVTRTEELTLGLIRLGLPSAAAFAFSTALRLVPTLVGAAVMILQAQKSRGLDVESGMWLTRIRRHVPLLVPVIATTLRSTDTFAMALEARGFHPRRRRTSLHALRLTAADWAAIAFAVAGIAVAVWLRIAEVL